MQMVLDHDRADRAVNANGSRVETVGSIHRDCSPLSRLEKFEISRPLVMQWFESFETMIVIAMDR